MISVVPRVEDVLAPTDVDDDDDGGGVVLCCVLSLSRALILILLIDFITGDGR